MFPELRMIVFHPQQIFRALPVSGRFRIFHHIVAVLLFYQDVGSSQRGMTGKIYFFLR
jgi:hypothetical protein